VSGTPYGIALDPAADRLWVTQTKLNTVSEFALNGPRPRLVRHLPTVRQPNTVGVDPRSGRVFVAGRVGELQIIPPAADREAPPRPDDAGVRCR
jgi:DNA-binding beta-propeller fold protein YncE